MPITPRFGLVVALACACLCLAGCNSGSKPAAGQRETIDPGSTPEKPPAQPSTASEPVAASAEPSKSQAEVPTKPEPKTTRPSATPKSAAPVGQGLTPRNKPAKKPVPVSDMRPKADGPADENAKPDEAGAKPPKRQAEEKLDQIQEKPGTPKTPLQSQANSEGGRPAEPSPDHDPCARNGESAVPVIDDTRQLLEEQTCKSALWLDGLFGENGGDEKAAKRTRGFLEVTGVYSEFGGFSSRTRLRVEYDLPNMENRLSAFVGRENDEDFVRGRTENAELRNTFPALGTDNKWLAGLGYSLPGTKNLQTQFRVGARGLSPPTAFVQGRLRYTLFSDDNDVAFIRTTPFWNTRDGFGVTQSFDYSRIFSRTHLLRWFSVFTQSERTEGLNWRNSLILYHNLELKRGLAYEAFIRGETDEPEPLYEYGARVLLRHPILRERLFLEWSTGYSFPRTDPEKPRDGSYNVGLSIELPFGTVDNDYY